MSAILGITWNKNFIQIGDVHVTTVRFVSPYGLVPAGTQFGYGAFDAYGGGIADFDNPLDRYYMDGAYPDTIVATGSETNDQFMERIRKELGAAISQWEGPPATPSPLELSVVKQSPTSYEVRVKLKKATYQGEPSNGNFPPGIVPATNYVSPVNVLSPFTILPP